MVFGGSKDDLLSLDTVRKFHIYLFPLSGFVVLTKWLFSRIVDIPTLPNMGEYEMLFDSVINLQNE